MTTEISRRIPALLAAAALFLAGAWIAVTPVEVLAQDAAEAPDPDARCVKCHSRGLKKKLEDGEVLSLKVDAEAFGTSVHSVIGCTGCHRDVAKGRHPSRQPIESRRSYSFEKNETCRQCHRAKYEAYDGSIHANLVRAGSDKAPLCSDCHSAHAIQRHETYDRDSGEPCSKCHTDIFTAYEESVHGTARREGNRIRADHFESPVCADCHSAHDISAVASTGYLVSTCMSCHEVAELAHEQWLPNAPMHMKSVGCSACHAPDAGLRVDLQLWDQVNQQAVGAEERYAPLRATLAEIGNEDGGISSLDLWKLIRLTKADGENIDVRLRGRLEVATGMDAHRLQDSGQATRTCENCHDGDSVAFDKVTVSITRADGRKERFEADKAVLSSVLSVDSISGFYAPGGTRIKLLDYLLVLAVLGGLAVPVVHVSLGKIIRRKMKVK
jgi:hypothetical protein